MSHPVKRMRSDTRYIETNSLQTQLANTEAERDALQVKRVFWREEAYTQRKYAEELKAARAKDAGIIQALQQRVKQLEASASTVVAEVAQLEQAIAAQNAQAQSSVHAANASAAATQQQLSSFQQVYTALETEHHRVLAELQQARAAQPLPPPPQIPYTAYHELLQKYDALKAERDAVRKMRRELGEAPRTR